MRKFPSFYILPITGVLATAIGVAGVATSNGGAAAFLIGVGIYLLVMCAFLLWRTPSRAWRKNESLRGPQTITFSNEGVEGRTILSETRSKWGLYKASYESTQSYMLRVASRRAYQIVPKRCLASPSDELTLRKLLETHTEAHLRTKSGHG